jgi:hypothetical protein
MKILNCRGLIAEGFKSRVHFHTVWIEVRFISAAFFLDCQNTGWGLCLLTGWANRRPLSASVLSYSNILSESTIILIYLLNLD